MEKILKSLSLWQKLKVKFDGKAFKLKDAYESFPDEQKTQVRARIYEHLGTEFQRIGKGLYFAGSENEAIALIEGDGRNLSILGDNSVECIITDHPWNDPKSNKGGNRNFAEYESFRYTQEDFNEKARVLKEGCFLVEMIPAENESNVDYLYEIKKMAEKAGFQYYAKVPWVKGTFVGNTGRKAKNSEDMMIFSLGKARNMRPDAKKDKADPSVKHYMSGANGMLPTDFNVQPPDKKSRIHQAEKPVGLVEQLLEYLTFEQELVLDQFAGSGVVGEACKNKNRRCILIEKSKKCVDAIVERLNLVSYK
jgi:site-specific DNA-methyltransferase (adenine-specific)